jgi:hypothetical protein
MEEVREKGAAHLMAADDTGEARGTVPGDRSPGEALPRPAWARGLERLDDDRLIMELRDLPAERQVELALSLGWDDRLRVIKASDLAEEVVRALPPEEVLLTIKGVGPDDALPILAHTSPEQFRFLLDVELWKRDQLDEAKVIEWLHHMLACGESRIVEFATTADLELLAIILRKLLYLIPNEEGVQIPEGLPCIMPDDFFTILANFPEEAENTRLLLRVIREADRDLFYKLLFVAHSAIDEEATETALRWRNSRLEDVGLLDFDEAVEIYGYIGEQEARALGTVPDRARPELGETDTAAPSFPVLLVKRRTLLYDLVLSLEDRVLAERLRREIAFSASRLLVADAEHIGEIESMAHALTRFFALANVGLTFLAGDDREEALRLLERLPLRDIFQVGFSRAADLKRQAAGLARRFWPDWADQGFLFLDHDRAESMRGLLERVPQYLPRAGEGVGPRDFETMEEVGRTRGALDEIEVVAEGCFDGLGIPRPAAAARAATDVFFENLILTAAVNLVVNGDFRFEPLSQADVRGMFERMLVRDASGQNRVSEPVRERVLEHLSRATGLDGRRWETFRGFVEASLNALEEEVSRVPSWHDLDPRYLRTLIFKDAFRDS